VVWLSLPLDLPVQDATEFLVHELTHQMLFLDDWRARHVLAPERLAEPATQCVSAVRRTRRRADLVFHSVIVAAEILAFRARHQSSGPFRLHPDSASLRAAALGARENLQEIPGFEALFSPRARAILQAAGESLRRAS
jgi:hypothetical protein